MLSKTFSYIVAVSGGTHHIEQFLEIAAELLGETGPVTIGDVLADFIVDGAGLLRPFFHER